MTRQTDSEPRGSPPDGPSPAVAYFAKAPRPGAVKTRLVPPLTACEAAGLYAAFVRETVVEIGGADAFCYGWPGDALDELRSLVAPGVTLRAQRGEGLFERMTACFAELFAEGRPAALIRNTDSPDLPAGRVAEALARCRPGRVVLGPDAGGGYYLIALAEPAPGLLVGLDEGAPTVLEATVSRARELGLEVDLLAVERDVDSFEDLLALWRDRR